MSNPDSQPQKIAVNRPLVGVISLACLATSGGLYFLQGSNPDWDIWRGAFMRAGLMMGALWFALPTRNRDAAWANVSLPALFGLIALVVVVPSRPRVYVPLLAVVAVIGFFLRPRRRRPDGKQSRPDRDSWQK